MGNPVELRTSPSIDLLYHGLAHLPLDNDASLYSEAYLARSGGDEHLRARLAPLADWYAAHFDRLASVGFLPFLAPDWAATGALLLNHPGYTEEDRARFLRPLLAALDEAAPRYLRWRQNELDRCAAGMALLRARLADCPVLAAMVRHTGKPAVAYLSCSLPRNGRGVLMRDALCAMAPAPATPGEAADAHRQLLHEYTHAWTDGLLDGPIAMDDGTHDLSEGLVLLADDWLYRLCQPAELAAYRAWAGRMLEADGPVTGADIAGLTGLGEDWQLRIETLVRGMAAG